MNEKLDDIYDAYKDQNDSRQKYYLAIVAFILGGALGYVFGVF